MLRCTRLLMVVAMTGSAGVACSPAPPAGEAAASGPELIVCVDPRPQICTAHYDPVCGRDGDGEYKTYANACSACSDGAVSGHRPGACE